jgi:hypothetical protein
MDGRTEAASITKLAHEFHEFWLRHFQNGARYNWGVVTRQCFG